MSWRDKLSDGAIERIESGNLAGTLDALEGLFSHDGLSIVDWVLLAQSQLGLLTFEEWGRIWDAVH